jgi:hypothetical protein
VGVSVSVGDTGTDCVEIGGLPVEVLLSTIEVVLDVVVGAATARALNILKWTMLKL